MCKATRVKPLLPLPPDFGCDITVVVDWSVLKGVLVADWSAERFVSRGTSENWLWSVTALWSEMKKARHYALFVS